jgi:hypothetical protein
VDAKRSEEGVRKVSDVGNEGLAGQATDRAQEAASVAQEKAADLKQQGSARLRDQLDQRSTEAGSQARAVASSLRSSSESVRGDGNDGAARLLEQAGGQIDRLGGYLEQKSGDEMMRDIENMARRRPWMIAGVGLLAGIAVARFVKASSEDRYQRYDGGRGNGARDWNGGNGDGGDRAWSPSATGARASIGSGMPARSAAPGHALEDDLVYEREPEVAGGADAPLKRGRRKSGS